MKKAVEYLKELFEEPFDLSGNSIESDFLNVIKQAQEDAIREAVKACAESADADFTPIGWLAQQHLDNPFIAGEDYEVYVIESSILSITDKLIKEL
jgi:hypothetical protein